MLKLGGFLVNRDELIRFFRIRFLVCKFFLFVCVRFIGGSNCIVFKGFFQLQFIVLELILVLSSVSDICYFRSLGFWVEEVKKVSFERGQDAGFRCLQSKYFFVLGWFGFSFFFRGRFFLLQFGFKFRFFRSRGILGDLFYFQRGFRRSRFLVRCSSFFRFSCSLVRVLGLEVRSRLGQCFW